MTTERTTRPLDALVMESHQGAAAPASEALTLAGHRVHRCHDDRSNGFPCRGVVDPDACPLAGAIDVALLVRWRIDPRPTELEQGVTCALRARVPLVEAGPSALDPYGQWLATRVEGDVVAACESAVAGSGGEPVGVAGVRMRTRARREG